MALATIAADKQHLADPTGSPFFVFGINYVGYFDRAWKMWEPDLYDPTLIARDFRKAQNGGFNTIRLFVQSALIQDVRRDDFSKLDETLSLAQDHQLWVLLILNDAHSLNLAGTAEIDAKIVARYKDVPTVLGYNLENEPVFYNLAAAIYPEKYPAPIQTSQLIDHYGVRVKREKVADLQQKRHIPGHLEEDIAFYYINALRLFLEYDADVRTFVTQGRGTLIDFMLSAEAEPWYTLIEVLDSTVEAWLKARIDPIRAAGCRHLLTVGWNWLHFAGLPANRLLDFQEYHNFSELGLTGFYENLNHLRGLRQAFPQHPLLMGEFGWSNQTGQDQASSRPVPAENTALYEAATYAYLRANGFAGGIKWILNDFSDVPNPYEASLGVFSATDVAKPIRDLVDNFSRAWPPLGYPFNFITLRESGIGLAYRIDWPQHIVIGGLTYQDQIFSWQGDGVAHCFIEYTQREIFVETVGTGRLSFDPWDVIPTWNRAHEADLFRLYGDHQRTRQHKFEAGKSVAFEVQPGVRYMVAMGAAAPVAPPPEGSPQVDPKPGEHVLLIGDFENYVHGALQYIRRFAPDFTFATEEVGGRWAYVSVIATSAQVSDEILDDIRSLGAILVERVIGETSEATKAMLDEMARRGQRFLTAITPLPPQEEPPDDQSAPDSSPGDLFETYIVQPGDTLSKIAQKVYGDARLWSVIFEANRDKIFNPSLIRVGLELHIPERA